MVEGTVAKFDRLAPGYSARDYGDPVRYAQRRARRAVELGPPMTLGGTVLDLGCGDANMAEPLVGLGFAYRGVDASTEMIAEARRRHPHRRVQFEVGDLEHYVPDEPVDLTLCLRALVYVSDRPAFFRRVLEYTRTKLVFDFNPRTQSRREIESELAASGFSQVVFEPFLLPQRVALPALLRVPLQGLERLPHAGELALRVRGIWFCAASCA